MADKPQTLPRHPSPPPDLNERTLPIISLQEQWIRSYQCFRGALYFNPRPTHRFNAPSGQYKVLYMGRDAHCAFTETFGHDDPRNRTITMTELSTRCLCTVVTSRPLLLVDLTGAGLSKVGADARLCSLGGYTLTQRWSRAFWQHPLQPDGIYYPARNDPSRKSLALFDRAASTLNIVDSTCLADPSNEKLVADLINTYNFSLIDDLIT